MKDKADAMQKSMSLSDEHAKIVDDELDKLPEIQLDPRGIMDLQSFMNLQGAITTATFNIKKISEDDFQTQRR